MNSRSLVNNTVTILVRTVVALKNERCKTREEVPNSGRKGLFDCRLMSFNLSIDLSLTISLCLVIFLCIDFSVRQYKIASYSKAKCSKPIITKVIWTKLTGEFIISLFKKICWQWVVLIDKKDEEKKNCEGHSGLHDNLFPIIWTL